MTDVNVGIYGLRQLLAGVTFTGAVREDMIALLTLHGQQHTIGHGLRVAAEVRVLAERFGADPQKAEMAGWLHDISAVIPNGERVPLAERLELDILPEERRLPMILHQKLSAVIARELFGVDDPAILRAIGCHTTLRAAATVLDKAVFLADKIRWDQSGEPPYLTAVNAALQLSLDHAVFTFVAHLWERRATLPVVHPWLAEAYQALAARLNSVDIR